MKDSLDMVKGCSDRGDNNKMKGGGGTGEGSGKLIKAEYKKTEKTNSKLSSQWCKYPDDCK